MKKILTLLMVLLMVVLLAACGGTESNGGDAQDNAGTTSETSDNTGSADSEEAAGFTVTVSGAVETEFTANGRFGCYDDGASLGNDPYLEIQDGNVGSSPNVTIRLPFDIEAGTYDLIGWGDTGALGPNSGDPGFIEFDAGREGETWDMGSGSITLDAIASSGREPVTGSFTAELSHNDTEDTVTVNGEFDFTAPSYAFEESGRCDGSEG